MLVPALSVFCTPEKLNDILGSSSLLNSFPLGIGNSISDTLFKTKDAPIPKAALAPKLAVAKLAPKPLPKTKAFEPKAPKAPKDNANNAPPNNILPKFPPEPLITGTILTPSLPIG